MTWPIWLVVVCLLAAVLAAGVAAALGRLTLPGEEAAGQRLHPPVLLPERPDADDVDLVRFSLDVPGYERGQVDEAMSRLADRIAEQDARIAELEGRSGHGAEPGSSGVDGVGNNRGVTGSSPVG